MDLRLSCVTFYNTDQAKSLFHAMKLFDLVPEENKVRLNDIFITDTVVKWCDEVLMSPIIACDIDMLNIPTIGDYEYHVLFIFATSEHACWFKLRFHEFVYNDVP